MGGHTLNNWCYVMIRLFYSSYFCFDRLLTGLPINALGCGCRSSLRAYFSCLRVAVHSRLLAPLVNEIREREKCNLKKACKLAGFSDKKYYNMLHKIPEI